jgi:8-oxo-dGTP pyrophosphatase MutT (NUDIX family)
MTSLTAPVLVPRPAATLILLREAADGVEVLMVRREPRASFAAGAWVYPGGVVEPVDHALSVLDGLGLPAREFEPEPEADRAAYRMAAIRECFEEAGLLVGQLQGSSSDSLLPGWRDQVLNEINAWEQLVSQRRFLPTPHRLHYVFRRITPPGLPRRFDTRFYVTAAPSGQDAAVCQAEVVDARWVNPVEALDLDAQGEMLLLNPTRASLQLMTDPALQEQVLSD